MSEHRKSIDPLHVLDNNIKPVTKVYTLTRAVYFPKIIGMNTHAIQQLLDTASTMLDHALKTYKEMRALEARINESESEEDKKQRRRLRALRWMMIATVTYAGYRVIKLAFRRRKQRELILDSMYPNGGMHSRQGTYPSSRIDMAPNWQI